MAVKLRLRREGAKKKPYFRVVAADHRAPRDGRFIEIIGVYHPSENPSRIEIDGERALHWLRNGAKATSSVEQLLRVSGIWEEFKPGDEPKRRRAPEAPRADETPVEAPAAAEASGASADEDEDDAVEAAEASADEDEDDDVEAPEPSADEDEDDDVEAPEPSADEDEEESA